MDKNRMIVEVNKRKRYNNKKSVRYGRGEGRRVKKKGMKEWRKMDR